MRNVPVTLLAFTLTAAAAATPASAAPSLLLVTPSSGPTQGSIPLTLDGTGFGSVQGSGSVSVGGADCGVSAWSDTQVTCTLPEGQATGRPVELTNDANEMSNTLLFNYDPPTILTVTAPSAPTQGNTTVTVGGTNFGLSGSATIGGADCPIVGGTYGHTSFDCFLPAGQGLNQAVVVTVDAVDGMGAQSSNTALLDYDPPSLATVSPTLGPIVGGISLTATGTNFGTAAGGSGSVTVGGAACEITNRDHTEIVCDLPAGSGVQPVQVTISGQSSNTLPFAYTVPAAPSLPGAARLVLLLLVLWPAWRRLGSRVRKE